MSQVIVIHAGLITHCDQCARRSLGMAFALVLDILRSGKSQGHYRLQPPETDRTRIDLGVFHRSNLAYLTGIYVVHQPLRK